MAWRKVSCLRWIFVVLLVLVCPSVLSRPQELDAATTVGPSANVNDSPTDTFNRVPEKEQTEEILVTTPPSTSSSRNVKNKPAVIGESIKKVANQLLENINSTAETPIVSDIRIPPKLKNQLPQKQKLKTRLEDNETKVENSHAGVAVPVTLEELESENKVTNSTNESSTTNEGISTWILLSNPTHKDAVSTSTEPTKPEESQKKQVINKSKNKTKRPTVNSNKSPTRPIIASVKSDLVAGGSAINDNVLNKIKDTVLSNVQKNKNTVSAKTTTTTTTEASTTAAVVEIVKKETVTKAPSSIIPVVKVTSKPTKKKNKNKQKQTSSTTESIIINESALMPMEPKEQEIELEVSTPATTTKKPKKTSSKRKKNKTKKRKTSTSKIDSETALEVKTSNKTKSAKPAKKPESPITTQIYNYLSREVMPSVGVGVIGLAGLVGLASYFFFPYATPVRRTFEVDKKDDIYRHNAEEYANEGNGQAEEEMLGTVLAGMPAHSKNRLNPYIAQTPHSTSMYSVKKEQDIRYRHVATNFDSPNNNNNYNIHYPQQKTGIAHAAVYADQTNYGNQKQDTRLGYTTESKYAYDKNAYTPYPAADTIYAVSHTDTTGFGNEAANSVVYGVKPSSESDFKPVYPFEGQVFSETTNNPATYPPTSMYIGSNSDMEQTDEMKYMEDKSSSGGIDNKFVVGNVPKDFVDSETPAVVPEHGPRSLNRKKRSLIAQKRTIGGTVEQILKDAKLDQKDIFLSNEIDEAIATQNNVQNIPESMNLVKIESEKKEEQKLLSDKVAMYENQFVESVSTIPLGNSKDSKTTTTVEPDISNEIATTTQSFKVYEVFSSTINSAAAVTKTNESSQDKNGDASTTTEIPRINTETTTDNERADATSTLPPAPSAETDVKSPPAQAASSSPKPTSNTNVITYPPITEEGSFFTFLRRLIEFKYRLGLSILQSTSESLNRYLRSMERTVQKL